MQPFAEALAAEAPLDELALAVSSIFQPDLDLIGVLAELDELAADCPTPTRDGIMQHLFVSGLFTGDRSDYHRLAELVHRPRHRRTRRACRSRWRSSASRSARRLGVELVGIGMPGHFLVGDPADPAWFADPFHGATALSLADCRQMLAAMGGVTWSDRFVEPTPPRLVIARMLNNLKVACQRRDDPVRLALVMQARREMREFASERADALLALATFN